MPPRYHHGNLRSALIEAGVQLAREGGPDAVVVREASRRVGVSHNAAYRHFPDRDRLLKAVCGRCMSALARLMEARAAAVSPGEDRLSAEQARLRAIGIAYVDFALAEPGWFRTAFAVPPGLGWLDPGEGVGERGLGPYDLLSAQLDALAGAGGLTSEERVGAEFAAWASVHGIAVLMTDGPLRDLSPGEREQAVDRVLRGLQI